MRYNVNYEVCALLFIIVLMVNFFTKKQIPSKQSRLFRMYMIFTFVDVIFDIASCVLIEYYQTVSLFIEYGVNIIFLSLQVLIPVICTMYIRTLNRVGERDYVTHWATFIPAVIVWAMLWSSPFTKLIFYFDENGYQHGSCHIFLYISMAIYVISALIKVFVVREKIPARQFGLTIAMIVSATSMSVAQLFFPYYSLSGVGLALSLFIMYMTIEDPVIYVDSLTNALNRDGFIVSMRQLRNRGKKSLMLVVAIDNFKIINEVFGMDGGNLLLEVLVKRLKKLFKRGTVYRYNGDIFVVVLDAKKDGRKAVDDIRGMLEQSWEMNNVEVSLSACICLIPPEVQINSDSELIKTIDYGVKTAKDRGKGQLVVVDNTTSESMMRNAAIEQAMLADIDTGSFEVHYQPIFDTKVGAIRSLEALARLNVPGYGYISPEEFIPIAEQNGMITDIGVLVLESVCKFYNEAKLQDKGIDFIEVNLSVVQCMQDNLHSTILGILDKYGISPRVINLEITESAAAYSEQTLVQNMEKMHCASLSFSMDDYGSGFSNVNNLIDMPFSIIKLDKYFVWAAFKDNKMRKVLQNTIAMFHDIDLQVVAEGVETREMVAVLTEMGVEYLQGYYYAKPLPTDKLLDLLSGGR